MATKLTMIGAKGRMGQAILKLARGDKNFEVVGEADHIQMINPLRIEQGGTAFDAVDLVSQVQ